MQVMKSDVVIKKVGKLFKLGKWNEKDWDVDSACQESPTESNFPFIFVIFVKVVCFCNTVWNYDHANKANCCCWQPKGVHLTPGDPRWIGAWWLGYVIGGSILIFSFMALLGFPRELPGAREKRDKLMKEGILPTKDEKIKEKLNGMIPATWQLLKNPVFIFNALALTASSFVGVGIAPFIVKVFYIKFNLNPAMAGLVMGIALIPGCGG